MEKVAPKMGRLPTIRRLPAYLHLLRRLQADGWASVSGTFLAEQLGLEAIQVRKDLTITGIAGRPRIGFDVPALIAAIEAFLGWDNTTEAVLVGVGHLGSALLGYSEFARHGLSIVAAFDTDPAKVGQTVQGKPVYAMAKLGDLVRRLHIRIGILAVPAEHADDAAAALVDAGVAAIWNFTPTTLTVPGHVIVQHEDLSSGLAVLSRKVHDRLEPTAS
jgi:redox-sensing transcriptional repressor